MSVHAELSILPIGTTSTSLSEYLAVAIKAIAAAGLRYRITPMCTLIEAEDLDTILRAAKIARDAVVQKGIKRVEIILKIDERLDKERSMDDKIRSIESKLKSE